MSEQLPWRRKRIEGYPREAGRERNVRRQRMLVGGDSDKLNLTGSNRSTSLRRSSVRLRRMRQQCAAALTATVAATAAATAAAAVLAAAASVVRVELMGWLVLKHILGPCSVSSRRRIPRALTTSPGFKPGFDAFPVVSIVAS